MREIKFRAWDKGLERFISPEFLYIGEDNLLVFDNDRDVENWTPNKDVVLMQYTGLKDKNGKEIFEGDIVTAREKSDKAPFKGYIHYLNAQYWVNYLGYESYYVPLMQLHGAEYEPIEVIGNIHSNPELLEVAL